MKDLRYKIRLMWAYKDAVRTRVPFLFDRMIRASQRDARRAAHSLKNKDVIDVAFLLTIPGMWKADYLFKAMQESPRFHPYIVVFPYSNFKHFDKQEIWNTINRTKQFVEDKGFECIVPYNENTHHWDNIVHTLNPDIVFFSTPYRDILPQFYYYNFRKKLTCYIPYAFHNMNVYPLIFDQTAINLYGLNFEESPIHLELSKKYSRSHGANFVCSGYPGTEVYLRNDYTPSNPWKPQSSPKKRIIWAPHHTIDNREDFQVSTFLDYCDEMIRLAESYADTVQFAFKPHQLLKFKLLSLWGEQKTNDYYQRWATLPNGQLEEAGYVDLFLQSDAMIHDCGSFTSEYLFLHKPVAYLVRSNNPQQEFNLFGEKAFEQHYKLHSINDIKHFIDDVVIAQNDPLHDQRESFFNQYLAPRDGKLPSQCIMQTIDDMINGKM